MALIGSNNALAWAHFRLRGGWVRSLSVTGVAMLLLGSVLIMTYRLNPADSSKVLWAWTTGLLVLLAACLVFYIPGRIGTIIRADLQTKMIESHRLMPLPPSHAVAGYIMGAATQPLVFCAGLFVLGAFVAAATGVELSRWSFAGAVLLAFAAFTWVIIAFSSLGGRLGGGIIVVVIIIAQLSQGLVLVLLPGLTVILSPVMGQSVFDLRTTGLTLPAPYAISFAAQAFFAAVFYIAAMRAYRSGVEPGLNTLLSLCLLGGWVAVTFAGLRGWEDFRPRGWNPGRVDAPTQVAASLIAALLLALGPIAVNALERARWRRHEAIHDPYPIRPPIPVVAVIALALAMILAIPFAPANLPVRTLDVLLRSAAVVLVALVGLYFLFEWLYTFTNRAAGPVVMWLIATWAAPVGIDWARYSLADYGEAEVMAGFSTVSPAGALVVLWTKGVVDTSPGIGMQILIALVPMTLWVITRTGAFRR